MQETRVWSLGREDPLEEEMATYSSILSWKVPWTEEPGGLQSVGLKRVRQDWGHTQFLLLALVIPDSENPLNLVPGRTGTVSLPGYKYSSEVELLGKIFHGIYLN